MEKNKIFTLFSLILVTSVHFFDGVLANPGAEIPGEWIIRMQDTAAESTFEKELATAGVSSLKRLVPSIPIYLGKNSDSRSLEKVTMSKLNSLKSVKYAHPNHKVTKREKNPNDPEFSKSYSLKNNVKAGADTKATFAWEIGTGGKDFVGNDIVVAVVDGGVDVEHQDLKANAWVNLKEVAGNKLDDDENGFVDDIHGWNAYDNSGNTGADDHGTHVAGIIGAQGDNALFTSGVNWNVKLMAVDGASGNTATVTIAYGYVYEQKRLWIESKGQKGANIVATNSSFGVDYADCNSADYKAWDELYEKMGTVGILSAAATINNNVDVDEKGDVPTGCSAEHILSVTNTTIEDLKFGGAGYGKTQIDLGAPGTKIVSTVPGNGLAAFTGTSMASPHVAGAVALLHSVASKELYEIIAADPQKGALEIKKIILAGVDPLESLKDKTLTGGRLNLLASSLLASKFGSSQEIVLKFDFQYPWKSLSLQ